MRWSNITNFENGSAVCSKKGVQNRFRCSRFLTVFDSGDEYAETALETLFFSKVGIDWIGIVMSTVSFNRGSLAKIGLHYCYVQALANMNEQDVNGNGRPGSCCYIDGYYFVLCIIS